MRTQAGMVEKIYNIWDNAIITMILKMCYKLSRIQGEWERKGTFVASAIVE